MTLVVGVGQAGCNLASEIAAAPGAAQLLDVLLVNSTMRDMVHIKNVPRTRWIGVNEADGLVPLARVGAGAERELTGGMGKDPRRCFTSLNAAFDKVTDALLQMKAIGGVDVTKERFALVLFSAGGGTGSGAGPVIARALREASENRIKTVGVVVLPAMTRGGEGDIGSLRESWNAWYSVDKSLQYFDGLIVVDNERLAHAGDLERAFPRFNQYVARTLNDMVLGNLTELVLPEAGELVMQQNDTQDLVTALSLGTGGRSPGVAGIGRGVQLLHGPAGYLLPFLPHKPADLVGLSHLARERLSLAEPPTPRHEKAYVLIRAPRRFLAGSTTHRAASDVLASIGHPDCTQIVYGTALTKRPLASVTLGLTFKPGDHPRLLELEEAARRFDKEEGAPGFDG